MQIVNDRLQNQLNMIGSCITTAKAPLHLPVWTGKEPADFALDLDALASDYGDANSILTNLRNARGGAGSVKDQAETAAEDAGFILARALCSHYRKTGDLDNLAKVDLTKTAIVRLRDQDLVATLLVIRDLGDAAKTQPGATGRGVTAALDDLVIQFDGTPEGLRFIEAWKRARVIVDAGHGPGEEETPTPPAPAPASK